jgi:uncharacterized phage protein (TIGR01671 family)
MHEILFRAKREDNGEWVYGYYVRLPDAAGSASMIHTPAKNPDENNSSHFVKSSTVGQFTGLTDRNGVKIFEGDIVQTYDPDEGYAVVRYDDDETEFYADFINDNVYYGLGGTFRADDLEIVGNVFDNPELIGGSENDT